MINVKFNNRNYLFEAIDEFSACENEDMTIELINAIINTSKEVSSESIEVTNSYDITLMNEQEADLFTDNFLNLIHTFEDLERHLTRVQSLPTCGDRLVDSITWKKAIVSKTNASYVLDILHNEYDKALRFFVDKFEW